MRESTARNLCAALGIVALLAWGYWVSRRDAVLFDTIACAQARTSDPFPSRADYARCASQE